MANRSILLNKLEDKFQIYRSKKKRYGFDYIRTKISKKSESPYQYIDDEEEA